MPQLIVNADDFGLTGGVNRAIIELHAAEVLTSATVMAQSRATEQAVEMARAMPSLGVGCHVVLVDGSPVLAPNAVRTLVDRKTGSFHPTLGRFLQRLLTGRIPIRGATGSEYSAHKFMRAATTRARQRSSLFGRIEGGRRRTGLTKRQETI